MRVAILTISDSVASGQRQDLSGPALRSECERRGWKVALAETWADVQEKIQARLMAICDGSLADVVFTAGGTGLGPRDVTPEATMQAGERLVPGLAEFMRRAGSEDNPRAVLSRGIVAQRGRTLIVNLPGSPVGAVESFQAIADLLPHALEVMAGGRHEAEDAN